jgi:UDP:flavonoid glycosyltransferase YjiC (YdhE family)
MSGTNVYSSGVPHLILPMWADCYDYASRAEYLKIGVYGNAKAAPNHTAQELIKAFSRVLGDGPESRTIRENAARLGEFTRRKPGRSRAAQEIARWANNEDL